MKKFELLVFQANFNQIKKVILLLLDDRLNAFFKLSVFYVMSILQVFFLHSKQDDDNY